MKRKFIATLSVATAAVLTLGGFSLPNAQNTTYTMAAKKHTKAAKSSGKPTTITILGGDSRVVKEGNEVQRELEKRTNTKLKLTIPPDSEVTNKLNTMAASNTLPDVVKDKNFYDYAKQGLLMDIGDLVNKYGPHLKKYIPKDLWELTKYKGKQVAIPYYNIAGKYVWAVRQDWLDKLHLKTPTNLDELYTVADKFANEDPDGNGKKDTYAFGCWEDLMPIFGGYGITEYTSRDSSSREYYIKDNKSYCVCISDEYKKALAYIHKLWKNKLIDPDFTVMQIDQLSQKLAQGKIGLSCNWWATIPEGVIDQLGFQDINPDGKWEIISKAPEGPGGPFGTSGFKSMGEMQNATWIPKTCKHPKEVIKFLDYLMTDEGYELTYYGIKGKHYTSMEEPRLPEGQKAFEEKWLDSFNEIVGMRLDISNRVEHTSTDPHQIAKTKYVDAGNKYNLYLNAFFGMPTTSTEEKYGTDLTNYELENRIAFITGERSLDEFDDYVKEWKEKGGLKILEADTKQYNELRSKHIEVGTKK